MDWQDSISQWLDLAWFRADMLAFGLVCIAVIAWRGDRRRMTRRNADAVGWMPWRDIAFWAGFMAFLTAMFGPYFV